MPTDESAQFVCPEHLWVAPQRFGCHPLRGGPPRRSFLSKSFSGIFFFSKPTKLVRCRRFWLRADSDHRKPVMRRCKWVTLDPDGTLFFSPRGHRPGAAAQTAGDAGGTSSAELLSLQLENAALKARLRHHRPPAAEVGLRGSRGGGGSAVGVAFGRAQHRTRAPGWPSTDRSESNMVCRGFHV